MRRAVIAVGLFALSALWVVGCDRGAAPAPTTGSTRPPSSDNKTDIHIRTPGARVDIEGKGEGKGVSVDVEKKER